MIVCNDLKKTFGMQVNDKYNLIHRCGLSDLFARNLAFPFVAFSIYMANLLFRRKNCEGKVLNDFNYKKK